MRLNLRLSRLLLAGLLAITAGSYAQSASADAKSVTVWIYHQFPPFIMDQDARSGLSYDLAQTLSEQSDGQYAFSVEPVTRGRLNHLLEKGEQGLVFWGNPAWFNDPNRTKYHWTQGLLVDRNDVISPIQRPVTYAGPDSLESLRLAGVRGHRYPAIDPLLESAKITREDVESEADAVMFIAHARADVSILASSAARHFAKQADIAGRVHFSPTVFSSYTRSILIQTHDDALADYVKDTVQRLRQSPAWQQMLTPYGLEAD